MKLRLVSLATVLALPLALHAGQPAKPGHPPTAKPMHAMPMASGTGAAHVMYEAGELKWGPAPPAFEPGAQAVVLSGDPGKPGLFVLRLKAPAGYKVATHWHPTDEYVTLLEGDLTLKMDENGKGAHEHTFAPGGYVLLPAKMHHAASTRTGMTLQVSGMGPFELNYIDPKDDPRMRPAK